MFFLFFAAVAKMSVCVLGKSEIASLIMCSRISTGCSSSSSSQNLRIEQVASSKDGVHGDSEDNISCR